MIIKNLNLVVVIPIYNEAETLTALYEQWKTILFEKLEINARLLFVNDGSKDKTPEILTELAGKDNRVVVINQMNGGHGKAVITGYQEALKLHPEWIFQTDSDQQILAEDFPKLWSEKEKSDFILAVRANRQDPLIRLIINRIMRLSLALFYGLPTFKIHDPNIPFRLMRASYLAKLLSRLPGLVFAPNIFLSLMASLDRRPLLNIRVSHYKREQGNSTIIRWKLIKVCFRTLKELFIFRFQLNHDSK